MCSNKTASKAEEIYNDGSGAVIFVSKTALYITPRGLTDWPAEISQGASCVGRNQKPKTKGEEEAEGRGREEEEERGGVEEEEERKREEKGERS